MKGFVRTLWSEEDEQIETTQGGRPRTKEWLVRFAAIAIVSVALFGGLYFAIVSFE